MKRLVGFIRRKDTLILAVIGLVIAAVSTAHSYAAGTIMAYGDAESHINIAKRIVDGLTPGLGQLGGVWLPLHHLLMAPFVMNDFMWRSGLGGSVVSALSFVATALFIYALVVHLTVKRLLGLLSFVVFAANPNVLYMLTTPMSELPLLAFMSGSIYYFIRWVADRTVYSLVLAAVLVLAASLIRYDAWFLLLIEVVSIGVIGIVRRWHHSKTTGIMILFVTLGAFGTVLWLLWCQVIFGDPLYFMNSPYSAKSQQLAFLMAGELPSYHNVYESVRLYAGAVIANIGIVLAVTSLLGAFVYLAIGRAVRSTRVILVLLLTSPLIFNVLALVLGISVLFVPGVTSDTFRYHLFNIRYGLIAMPAVAILSALLVDTLRIRMARFVTAGLVFVAAGVFALSFPVTLQDGLRGLSARFPNGVSGINADFQKYYDHGYVAFDDFSRSANPVSLGIPMNKIIYVGSHPYWEETIAKPNNYARFIIIRKDDVLDRAFTGNAAFRADYTPVYRQGDVTLYECTAECHGWAR